MEKTYDSLGAKAALIPLFGGGEREQDSMGYERPWLFKPEGYKVHQVNSPPMFKLVKDVEVGSAVEEATFIMHGIILKKDLPPIEVESGLLQDQRKTNRYAGIIRQYVAVSGLNIEEFNKILDGLGKIHGFFGDSLPNKRLQPISPLVIEDNVAVACHTRYFSSARYCRSATAHPFGPGVDPNGELEKLQGTSFIHTEDNAVQYMGKKFNGGETRYFNISPTRFQKGDIVEVTFSIICVPTRTDDLKMFASLKTLTLIDDKFREMARESQVRVSLSRLLKGPELHVKRRFVPTEDDQDNLVYKCARMDL